MKNTTKIMTVAAVMVMGTAAFAGPRNDHHERDGLDLAYGIVKLVCGVFNPQPVIVHPAPPPPVVHKPAPRPAPKKPAPKKPAPKKPAPKKQQEPPRKAQPPRR